MEDIEEIEFDIDGENFLDEEWGNYWRGLIIVFIDDPDEPDEDDEDGEILEGLTSIANVDRYLGGTSLEEYFIQKRHLSNPKIWNRMLEIINRNTEDVGNLFRNYSWYLYYPLLHVRNRLGLISREEFISIPIYLRQMLLRNESNEYLSMFNDFIENQMEPNEVMPNEFRFRNQNRLIIQLDEEDEDEDEDEDDDFDEGDDGYFDTRFYRERFNIFRNGYMKLIEQSSKMIDLNSDQIIRFFEFFSGMSIKEIEYYLLNELRRSELPITDDLFVYISLVVDKMKIYLRRNESVRRLDDLNSIAFDIYFNYAFDYNDRQLKNMFMEFTKDEINKSLLPPNVKERVLKLKRLERSMQSFRTSSFSSPFAGPSTSRMSRRY